MNISITLKVSTNNEWGTDEPTHLVVDLSPKDVTWIKKLAATAKKLNVYGIEDFNYLPTYMKAEEEDENEDPVNLQEWEGGIEYSLIHIHKDEFKWYAVMKHSDVTISSDSVPIRYLNKLVKMTTRPIGDMPRYINDKDMDIKEIARRRLKDGK